MYKWYKYRKIEFGNFKIIAKDYLPEIYYNNQKITIENLSNLILEEYNFNRNQASSVQMFLRSFIYEKYFTFPYVQLNIKNIELDDENYVVENGIVYNKDKTELIKCFDEIENVKISKKTIMINRHAFSGCQNIKEIIIPNNVKQIKEEAFKNCYGVEKIKLSKNISVLQSNTFTNCKNLKEIDFNNNDVDLGRKLFVGCENLKNIEFPDCMKKVNLCALYKSNVESIKLPKNVEEIYTESDLTQLKEIKISRKNTRYKVRDNYLIEDNNALIMAYGNKEKFVVPEGINYIETGVFENFQKLKSITFPKSLEAYPGGKTNVKIEELNIQSDIKDIQNFLYNDIKTININTEYINENIISNLQINNPRKAHRFSRGMDSGFIF